MKHFIFLMLLAWNLNGDSLFSQGFGNFFMPSSSNTSTATTPSVPTMSIQTPSASNSPVDINTLTSDQLANLPAYVLQEGISQVTDQYNQSQSLYTQTFTLNNAMCKLISQVDQQCPTQAYLVTPQNPMCSGSTSPTEPSQILNPSITVLAKNTKGYIFRIVANQHYISDAFTEGLQTIRFHRDDTQPITQRFRDLVSMSLVSVVANSTITSGGNIASRKTISASDQATLLKTLQITLSLNGQPLLGSTNPNLILTAPQDPNVQTELEIDPSGVMHIGKTGNCYVSMTQINQLKAGISP